MTKLTEQQMRVTALVAEGLLNKEIAHLLGTSEGTIKSHVSTTIDKLGLKNRVQLAVWFVRNEEKWTMKDGRFVLVDALTARENAADIPRDAPCCDAAQGA